LIPRFRVAPPGAAQLSADSRAPYLVWFTGERESLQLATSALGLGIDVTGDGALVVAGKADLQRLQGQLDEIGSSHSQALSDFLNPVESWKLRAASLPLDRPIVMGILNLTEDSFSGDGVGADLTLALGRAEALRSSGAALIDVGAESARADRPVLEAEREARIVAGAVAALTREGHIVSSDTYKPAVARAAIDAGAQLLNDISGLTLGTAVAEEAARAGAAYVLNYSYSVPKRRPDSPPRYDDVMTETVAWFESRLEQLRALGLPRERVAIDPGIAFGKSHDEDLQVLRRLGELQTFGQPVMLAHSRKNFIGSVGGRPPADRDLETHVAGALAFAQGARIFRVHDAEGARRALEMAAAIISASAGAFSPDEHSWPWKAGAGAAHMTASESDKPAPTGQRW
jgi:dihydropteroate synthase